MTTIGTPLSASATRVMTLGAGELGKEVIIELQRLGVEVIAVDRYDNAPGMQVAHRSHVINMLDGDELRRVIETEKPHLVVPEIEAIATPTLVDMEAEGWRIIPTARAARLTMNREGIRRLAAETLGVATSPYRFAATAEEYLAAIDAIGTPCVVKPVMSSSGKGQTTVRFPADAMASWHAAREGARGGADKVIVEGFIDFDYEITLLTVRHRDGVTFCAPIGHRQEAGDYQESWQPQPMSDVAMAECQRIAALVTGDLGGSGIFGVEFFIKDDTVWFSEVSPAPARHGYGHPDQPGPLGIRPARPGHPGVAGPRHPPVRGGGVRSNPCSRRLGPSDLRQPRSGAGRGGHPGPPVRQARRCAANVAWVLRWRWARASMWRARRPRPRPRRSKSRCRELAPAPSIALTFGLAIAVVVVRAVYARFEFL